jgi:hypothetical protein
MDTRKGMPVKKLFFMLVVVGALIWFASNGTMAELLEPFF